MKKLVVFTLYDEKGASSRYRAYIFKKKMQEVFDVSWYTFWDHKYTDKYMNNKASNKGYIFFLYVLACIKRIYQLLFIVPKADIVFIQKECIPRVKELFLTKAKKRGVRIVYDIDDANYVRRKDNSDRIATIADTVICGNDTLYDHYSKINNNCHILPTVEVTPNYAPYWQDTFDSKIIGWIGSNASVKNLEVIVDAMNKFLMKHQDAEFHIISDSDNGFTKRIVRSKLVKWGLNSYLKDMSKFTVGIMPLKDTSFNVGKCGFKLIQYLNMKKPVIATDLGANRDIVSDCGLLADSTDEWVNALEALLYDKNRYLECVGKIESSFFQRYDFDYVASKLIAIIRG